MPSSRRAGAGERSILASLERAKAGASTHPAWLAGGAAVVLLLIVVLAWLAYSNATKVRVLPGAQTRQVSPPDLLLSRSDAPVATGIVMAAAAPRAAALIVDAAPAAPAAAPATMVMLAPVPQAAPAPKPSVALPRPPVARAVPAAAPARRNKTAPPPKPEPEAVDTDVALLSAIVAHASSHAAERAQQEAAACAGKKCGKKPAAHP